AFATAENTVASDNPGQRNGLFTKHLLTANREPGVQLDRVYREVKRRVAEESRSAQRPWTWDDATEDFLLRPPANPQPSPSLANQSALRPATPTPQTVIPVGRTGRVVPAVIGGVNFEFVRIEPGK